MNVGSLEVRLMAFLHAAAGGCGFCGTTDCPHASDPDAACRANTSNERPAAPVSEVRTGPLGLSEDETRYWAGRSMGGFSGPWATGARALESACREWVARWGAEDTAEPDTITVELRTRGEWCRVLDVFILDDGGWRDPTAPPYDEPITRSEFDRRFAISTVATRHSAGLSVPSEGGER